MWVLTDEKYIELIKEAKGLVDSDYETAKGMGKVLTAMENPMKYMN